MKRAKKLYVLLGILVVVCAATFGVSKYEEKKELIKNSDEIILELDSEAVTKLSWEYEETSLSFHKDDTWIYDGDEAFPVSEEKVQNLLSLFESFGVSFIIEEAEDYGMYGLDDPVCTITIETGTVAGEEDSKDEETTGSTYEILLGDYSTMDSQRYVSIGDGNVYLVSADPMESFEITLEDMILDDEIPDFDDVSSIQFAGTENYEVVYEEENTHTYSEEDVYFTEQDGETLALDTSLVTDYLDLVSSLVFDEYATYNATEEELESYGLDDPELSMTIDYSWEDAETEETLNDTFVLNVARDPKERKAAEEAEEAEEETTGEETEEEEEITAYARIGESQIVYKLTGTQYENLMKASCSDLRHQQLVWADFDDVYQIDISLEGKDYTITSEEGEEEDEDRIYYYGDEEIDIFDFRTSLKALTAVEFTDEKSKEKEEISVVLYLENENQPEVSIELYRYDGENCLAVIDGESVCLVSRSGVVDLAETVNAVVLN